MGDMRKIDFCDPDDNVVLKRFSNCLKKLVKLNKKDSNSSTNKIFQISGLEPPNI
jgi:hypothetical protein